MKGTPESRREDKAPAPGCDARVRAVILVGFMGAGKTSVGRALGGRLGWRFHDLDDRVRAREGQTVADIFRESGETEFRRVEHAALPCWKLRQRRPCTSTRLQMNCGAAAQQTPLSDHCAVTKAHFANCMKRADPSTCEPDCG
jgi:hypothetical protein